MSGVSELTWVICSLPLLLVALIFCEIDDERRRFYIELELICHETLWFSKKGAKKVRNPKSSFVS